MVGKDILAICGLCSIQPKAEDFLIYCQNESCKKGYHGSCVNIPEELGVRFLRVLGQVNWTCPTCCGKDTVPNNRLVLPKQQNLILSPNEPLDSTSVEAEPSNLHDSAEKSAPNPSKNKDEKEASELKSTSDKPDSNQDDGGNNQDSSIRPNQSTEETNFKETGSGELHPNVPACLRRLSFGGVNTKISVISQSKSDEHQSKTLEDHEKLKKTLTHKSPATGPRCIKISDPLYSSTSDAKKPRTKKKIQPPPVKANATGQGTSSESSFVRQPLPTLNDSQGVENHPALGSEQQDSAIKTGASREGKERSENVDLQSDDISGELLPSSSAKIDESVRRSPRKKHQSSNQSESPFISKDKGRAISESKSKTGNELQTQEKVDLAWFKRSLSQRGQQRVSKECSNIMTKSNVSEDKVPTSADSTEGPHVDPEKNVQDGLNNSVANIEDPSNQLQELTSPAQNPRTPKASSSAKQRKKGSNRKARTARRSTSKTKSKSAQGDLNLPSTSNEQSSKKTPTTKRSSIGRDPVFDPHFVDTPRTLRPRRPKPGTYCENPVVRKTAEAKPGTSKTAESSLSFQIGLSQSEGLDLSSPLLSDQDFHYINQVLASPLRDETGVQLEETDQIFGTTDDLTQKTMAVLTRLATESPESLIEDIQNIDVEYNPFPVPEPEPEIPPKETVESRRALNSVSNRSLMESLNSEQENSPRKSPVKDSADTKNKSNHSSSSDEDSNSDSPTARKKRSRQSGSSSATSSRSGGRSSRSSSSEVRYRTATPDSHASSDGKARAVAQKKKSTRLRNKKKPVPESSSESDDDVANKLSPIRSKRQNKTLSKQSSSSDESSSPDEGPSSSNKQKLCQSFFRDSSDPENEEATNKKLSPLKPNSKNVTSSAKENQNSDNAIKKSKDDTDTSEESRDEDGVIGSSQKPWTKKILQKMSQKTSWKNTSANQAEEVITKTNSLKTKVAPPKTISKEKISVSKAEKRQDGSSSESESDKEEISPPDIEEVVKSTTKKDSKIKPEEKSSKVDATKSGASRGKSKKSDVDSSSESDNDCESDIDNSKNKNKPLTSNKPGKSSLSLSITKSPKVDAAKSGAPKGNSKKSDVDSSSESDNDSESDIGNSKNKNKPLTSNKPEKSSLLDSITKSSLSDSITKSSQVDAAKSSAPKGKSKKSIMDSSSESDSRSKTVNDNSKKNASKSLDSDKTSIQEPENSNLDLMAKSSKVGTSSIAPASSDKNVAADDSSSESENNSECDTVVANTKPTASKASTVQSNPSQAVKPSQGKEKSAKKLSKKSDSESESSSESDSQNDQEILERKFKSTVSSPNNENQVCPTQKHSKIEANKLIPTTPKSPFKARQVEHKKLPESAIENEPANHEIFNGKATEGTRQKISNSEFEKELETGKKLPVSETKQKSSSDSESENEVKKGPIKDSVSHNAKSNAEDNTDESSTESDVYQVKKQKKRKKRQNVKSKKNRIASSSESDVNESEQNESKTAKPQKSTKSDKQQPLSNSNKSDKIIVSAKDTKLKSSQKKIMSSSESENESAKKDDYSKDQKKNQSLKKIETSSSSNESENESTKIVVSSKDQKKNQSLKKIETSSSSNESENESTKIVVSSKDQKLKQSQKKIETSSSSSEAEETMLKKPDWSPQSLSGDCESTSKTMDNSTEASKDKQLKKQPQNKIMSSSSSESENDSDKEVVSSKKQKLEDLKNKLVSSSSSSESDNESTMKSGAKPKIQENSESSSESEPNIIIRKTPDKGVRSSQRQIVCSKPSLDSYLKAREKKKKSPVADPSPKSSSDSDCLNKSGRKINTQKVIDSNSDSDANEAIVHSKRKLSFEGLSSNKKRKNKTEEDDSDADNVSVRRKKKAKLRSDSEDDGSVDDDDDEFIVPDDYEENSNSEESAESGDEAEPVTVHKKKSDVASEMAEITRLFSRRTENDLKNREIFLTPTASTPTRESKRNKKLEKNRVKKEVIYKPLIDGLRPMSSKKGLRPSEIISEWVLYQTMDDKTKSGKCICGRTGLRYLNWMHNKNIEDITERTLYYKVCIGSECIYWFNKSLAKAQSEEIDSPIVLFDIFQRKGVTAVFKEELKQNRKMKNKNKRKFIFKLKGKFAAYIRDNIEQILQEYNFKVDVTSETIELQVLGGKALIYKDESQKLDVGKKYKIHLKTKVNSEGPPRRTTFFLTRYDEPKPKQKSYEENQGSGKRFLR